MTTNAWLPLLVLASSLIPGLIIFTLPEKAVAWRITLNLGGALLKILLLVLMMIGVFHGVNYEFRVPLVPGIDFVLHADALSLLFVNLSAVLWLATTVYAIGYLEDSPNRSRFFGYFSLCVTTTVGLAMAGNLLTFLVFYEALTLSTYPLVVHRGTEVARKAGRTYLAYTLLGGVLLLAGTIWLHALTGTLEFVDRGFVRGLDLDPATLRMVFTLLILGVGVKAALVPLHAWLPQAMVAPAPVSALLHAVAVVKAGAFGVVRIIYDVFGIEFAAELGVTLPLAVLAAVTIIYGSVRALFQEDLKRRLAFSTVSQVSYITLGVAIAGPIATIGGLAHLVHQGFMKITLFFCAGNYAETLGVHKVSELRGIGRRMPWTTAAFTVAAFGMIGVPPVVGFVSKWYLGLGALEVGQDWVVYVLAGSSLLNAAYFLPLVRAAWFEPPPDEWPHERNFGRKETAWMLLLPPLFTALAALAWGLFASMPGTPLDWVQFIAARKYGS
ncbi:proton-conducting transporter membrane subunit [Thioalkalivibrio sp. XN8]|uniref:proton-conducting transporter transmembrane domain-containing protein n=1 Tax=Thioalkalivibrio sp. XN8 TaxID=2712863 RepID=UPI0013EE3523|nr:proton-conducting transporter membrane subunit [Thioalkalivibrio sp. XN8]NGP52695.1 monovalent cation/H+ antiporter subunit D family protein [Thioalkalivibrio sp. XN8]